MGTEWTGRRGSAAVVALIIALGGCSTAESSDAPTTERPAANETAREATKATRSPLVAAGTELAFRTDQSISTSDNQVGDYFTATLVHDVTARDGQVLLPAGTPSRWEVTRVTEDDGEGNAVLAFRLRSVRSAQGWTPVHATVVDTDLTVDQKDSDRETAAKVAVGAAAGALVGQILGKNTKSTLKGAAAGTAMGAVVALSTRGGSARLEEGALIRVRLDEAWGVY